MEALSLITAGAGIVKSLIDITKQITANVDKKENPELLDAAYDMREKALALQDIIFSLKSENEELRNELKRLKDNSDMESKLKRYEGKTYLTLDNEDGTKRYICSTCWEKDKELITLLLENNGRYTCPSCKNNGIYDQEKHSAAWSGFFSSSPKR